MRGAPLEFLQREIKQTLCDYDGRVVNERECPHHFYIILSFKKYNEEWDCVTAVPITSKEVSLEALNYGIDLFPREDLEPADLETSTFRLDKDMSFILYDRPSRLDITKFKKINEELFPKECIRIKKKVYDIIINNLCRHLKWGSGGPINRRF